MDDIAFASAKRLASLIRRKKLGCLELLEHYLGRVERYNPRLNAIIATDLPAARRRARAADKALAKGEIWGPLHGVPMTIKESFDVAGMPTTWGLPELKDNRPKRNALAVDRLLKAGVVLFGKTNVPVWLADWQSYNDIYGTSNNPWDRTQGAGRLLGRRGRSACRGPHGDRGGQRHRLVDPQSRALLRRLRPEADLRHLPAARTSAARAASRRATSPSSDRSRAAPTIWHSPSPQWPDPTRSTAPAINSACRSRKNASYASSRSPSCWTTPTPRSTARCRTSCRGSRISSPRGKRR